MADIKADVHVDACGLNCPMPVLKAKKAIDALEPGQVMELIATDSGTKADIPALLKRLGHELLGTKEENKKFYYYIRKK
ncbi:MAG: sulfurtransferase TusA family protein [Thermodesulfovibrionales bacterium]|nr:sulfurtransferase TusA family protein [Thermodesulfovibrionales bacterium]